MITDLDNFVYGAAANLIVVAIIVRLIYYPVTQNRSYVFTFLAFSPTIYFVMSLLTSVEISVGVGFGLFAIFSVIRYRTEEMAIREMTYLFVIIALPIMNAILATDGEITRAVIINGATVGLLLVLEREWGFRFDGTRRVLYDRIELIVPERHDEMIRDLQARTGLPITRVDIGRIDFLRDVATVTVHYDTPGGLRTTDRRHGLDVEHQPAGRQLQES